MAGEEEDRRSNPRHLVCFPAHLETPGNPSPRTTLIRDVSLTGALLFSQKKLEIGEAVKLEMFTSLAEPPPPPRIATGRIVRCEPRDIERADVWRWDIGVRFDEPLTELEPELKELSERLKRRGVMVG